MTKDGIGAPLVAVRHLTAEQAAALFAPPAIYYGVTGIVEFEGSRCILSIKDPLAAETVTVDGRTYPMAANFTASLAMALAREKPQKLGLVRLLRPEEYASTFRVARMEPYNPNKSVVLVIHGLMDTPATLGATDKRFAQRQRDPAQLPVLVLQLSQRLSLSL